VHYYIDFLYLTGIQNSEEVQLWTWHDKCLEVNMHLGCYSGGAYAKS
jgi:hypothetical protein